MTYRIFSTLLFSCFFLVSCASSNSITPSSVPSQSKNPDQKTNFKIENQSPASLVRLAKGFQQSGDLVSALNFYGKASAANPNLIEPWLGIIGLLREFNNPIGARRAIKDARKYHPNDPDIALIAAEIEIADDKATQAITILAPHMARNDYRFSNLLGVASEMMGSTSVARNYYASAKSINLDATRITDNLALSYSFYNDHKTAISILQKNLNDSQNRKLSYETLAIIYAIDDQLDAALNIARSALSDEEITNNYAFYQALPKLPPAMRARAVFTRTIPFDAMPYLQDSTRNMTNPEQARELSKAEMARQLVNQHTKKATPKTKKEIKIQASKPISIQPEHANKGLTVEDQAISVPAIAQASAASIIQQKPVSIIVEEKEKLPEITEEIVAQELPPETMGSKIIYSEESMAPLPEKITAQTNTADEIITTDDKAAEETKLAAKLTGPARVEKGPAREEESPAMEEMAVVLEARNAYRVQIAAFTNMVSAQNEWCRIAKRVVTAEVYEQPNVRIFGEGPETRYRLLLGEYDDRADANATCEALKSQKLGCYVVKGAGQLRPLESDCKR